MTVIPSRYARADLTFPRQRTPDNTQWQSSRAPLEPLWKSWVAGILFVFFLTGVMALVSMFGG